MKLKSSIAFAAALMVPFSHALGATIWNYDFGTATGTHTTGASTDFLPAPSTGGGTARVRIGTGSGSFSLVNPGSGSRLEGLAASNTSVNKFSIYDYSSPSPTVTLSFDMMLSGSASGTWYMFVGDGATFSDNSGFTGTQTFAALRFQFGANDTITVSNRAGGTWTTVSSTGIEQNSTYNINLVGNNTTSAITYGSQTLAASSWDLYVNNSLVTTFSKAQLADGANIDSFMFYGESSSGNAAKITLDNITYANYAVPEPGAALLGGLGLLALLRRRR